MTAPRFLVALLGSALIVSPVGAAEQGASGAVSKGEIAISVTVASRVTMSARRVTTSAPRAGDTPSACLWLDTATRGYAVAALDAPVAWRASATARDGTTIAPGARLANLSSAAAHPDCDGDPALLVGYDRAGAASARPATLLIAPE